VDSAHQRLREQADRLQTLNEIGRVVSATLDLGALYETIYQQVARVMDATQLFISLLRPERSVFELVYHREDGELQPVRETPFGPNVTSLVVQRGTPLLFQSHAEYVEYTRANGLPEVTVGRQASEAKIWVPLNTGNRAMGALSVQSTRRDAYTEDDLQTLLVIASQAAVAIENARLYYRSQQDVRRMQALLRVAQIVNGSLDLHTVLNSVLIGMREVMPYYLAAILLPDHQHGWLDIVGAQGPLSEERRRTMKIPFGEGITGRVYATGEPLNCPDVTRFEGYIEHGIREVHAEMAVPLRRGETVVGVLDVEREAVGSFSPDDIDLMTLFASQAAIAIENARLFEEQQKRVRELQIIQSIVQDVTPLHEVPAIADVVDRELNKLIDYHACRIFSLDEESQMIEPITTSGTEAVELRLRIGEGLAGWIAEHGEPVLIRDTLKDDRVAQIPGTPRRAESLIGVPLSYQGRVRGVITLSRLGANQFDENDLRLLEIIAAQAAIAFDRAMLYQRLRTEAVTDPVTRLYNRRYLFERFREEKSRAVRNKHSLIAVMLDIDKFKQVNDSFGHDAGDVVLEELARLVRGVVRAEDLVARYGGEEFCVLLPEIPLRDALSVAERLRWVVEHFRLPPAAGAKHITVSVGVAYLLPTDRENEVFTRADQAMYEVKHIGGNQVCLIGDGEPEFPYREMEGA
jgi:diguanylate cyclase (GGDEF)-like protein